MKKGAWFALGVFVYAIAAAITFLLVAPRVAAAIPATIGVLLAPPVAVAMLLHRGLAKVDDKSSFFANVVGLSALWAIAIIVLVLAFGRGPLASALADAPRRYPNLPAKLREECTYASRVLSPTTTSTSTSTPTSTSTSTSTSKSTSTSTSSSSSTSTAMDGSSAQEAVLFADIEHPCAPEDKAFQVRTADLDGDGIDEIIVKCLQSIQVLGFPKGADNERVDELYLFTPDPPPDWKRDVGMPDFGDADGDGKADLLLCVTWTTRGGGTRGGMTWYAPILPDRKIGELKVIDPSPCMAVAMHDITGDKKAELLIVNTGNPWQKEAPNGAVAWMTKPGKTWQTKSRLPVSVYPDDMTFQDLDGDGIDDVIVSHGWDSNDPTVVLLGSPTGLKRAPPSMTPPPRPLKDSATARFDDDAIADRVAIDLSHRVQIFRSRTARAPVIREISRR